MGQCPMPIKVDQCALCNQISVIGRRATMFSYDLTKKELSNASNILHFFIEF